MRLLLILVSFLSVNTAFGQYFMYGGYKFGAINMEGSNAIVEAFNQRENHSIGSLSNSFHGYEVGAGRYGKFFLFELGFSNLISTKKSTNPNQLKESAEVVANYMGAHARIGFKPFPREFFTFGLALDLGAQRIRYSFGGDYQTPVNQYIIAPEFYLEYAIKIKFLLKKSQREKYFYLLRIRPYYQLHQYLPIGKFETDLNETPNVAPNDIEEDFSHFGFSVALVIPFMRDEDREFLFKPRKKKKKKNSRPKKGVL